MSFLPTPEYLAQPRNPYSWVIEDILPTGGLLNIYGKPKSGKSFLAVQMAEAIAIGAPDVVGFPIHQHGRVAYLQLDTPRAIWTDRIQTHFAHSPNILWADSDTRIVKDDSVEEIPYPFDIMTEGYHWLKAKIAEAEPLVVVIDTLREVHSGDENDSTHMRNMINTLIAACRPAAMVVLSHARKNASEGGFEIMSENRGSGYVAGRFDGTIHLSSDDKKPILSYKSRTAGEEKLPCLRTPLIQLADPMLAWTKRVARDKTRFPTIHEKVAFMTKRFPQKGVEAHRSALRRQMEGQG